MATQLRLVDPPPTKITARRAAASSSAERAPSRTRRARVGSSRAAASSGRRAARWGDWQLDANTRSIGRAGVAAAREALLQAAEPDSMSRAS
ncbi:MAG: hypothetical protein ABW033_08380 [Acidimicrobiia bacterium]